MSNARSLYTAMQEAREGKITPDEYRALVRKIKAEAGTAGYEKAKITAISNDIRHNG